MVEMIFGGVLLIGFLTSFTFSLNWSAWNRAYVALSPSSLAPCVVNYDNEQTLTRPYFDYDLSTAYLRDYAKINLEPHCVSMSVKLLFKNPVGGSRHFQTLSFQCKANFGWNEISRSTTFTIKEVIG